MTFQLVEIYAIKWFIVTSYFNGIIFSRFNICVTNDNFGSISNTKYEIIHSVDNILNSCEKTMHIRMHHFYKNVKCKFNFMNTIYDL